MVSVRIGRLVLRSRRRYVMWLPSGYRTPLLVYLVEYEDERDEHISQLGGFTTLHEAEACLARLESEGWKNLHINLVWVHERLTDWQWDR